MAPLRAADSVLSIAAVRAVDRLALERYGLPGVVLMENAGRNAAERVAAVAASRAKDLRRAVILCGPGNNGGDGFVVARHLANSGFDVTVACSHPAAQQRGDSAWARDVVARMRLDMRDLADGGALAELVRQSSPREIWVDALLGTASEGPPRGAIAACLGAIDAIQSGLRVALDLPSGLDADSGRVHEPCFRADLTLTFAARKPGLVAGVCGQVEVIDIGVPRELLRMVQGL